MITRRRRDTEYAIQLGKFIREVMGWRGMSQADLARAVFGTTRDTRGYVVPRGTERIGAYLNGRTVPNEKTLRRIWLALGLNENDSRFWK